MEIVSNCRCSLGTAAASINDSGREALWRLTPSFAGVNPDRGMPSVIASRSHDLQRFSASLDRRGFADRLATAISGHRDRHAEGQLHTRRRSAVRLGVCPVSAQRKPEGGPAIFAPQAMNLAVSGRSLVLAAFLESVAMERATTKLRRLLKRDHALVAAGAFGPMPAKLAEQAGFEAVYMPGGGTALSRLGVADLGLITMTEMVENAAAIAQCVSVPVIADADTGFGNQLNVQRTVREYERAGVAAIHLEDQEFPKRCGSLPGKTLVPLAEAAQKIRAAVAARSDPDFMIIARCDALLVAGMDEVIRRGEAYLEAGADMLFIESARTVDEIADIPQRLPGAHLFNLPTSGKTPYLSADEVTRLGYKLMILPNFTALAAIKAMTEVLAEIRRTGSVAGILDRCATFQEFTELGGLPHLQETEKRFASPTPQPAKT
ncbi:oxaloacetate decarboxylase [Variovorax sp. WS11]|nr:oxaloacetate decarboxylase [Variovorax sp. WS11]